MFNSTNAQSEHTIEISNPPYERDTDIVLGDDLKEWNRYLQWELNAPDFQHLSHPMVAANQSVALAAAITNREKGDPDIVAADYQVIEVGLTEDDSGRHLGVAWHGYDGAEETPSEAQTAVLIEGVESVTDFGQLQELRMRPGIDTQQVLRSLMQQGRVTHFELTKPSLHDIFVRIAGPEALEAGDA
ncbi:MAG: DUF4162 domain-containing protein [Planctomycetes bacterium]|nr:DUF4162 domain-containing protein [Planctomycetota bacterium]